MTTDNFSFYLQSRVIQIGQTGGQWFSDTSPFIIPCLVLPGFASFFSAVAFHLLEPGVHIHKTFLDMLVPKFLKM
jgi:hypothetical protein